MFWLGNEITVDSPTNKEQFIVDLANDWLGLFATILYAEERQTKPQDIYNYADPHQRDFADADRKQKLGNKPLK